MRVGRYEIIGTLGSGGMSSVSLARSPKGQLVVLKRQHHPDEDEALRDEARVGSNLTHPAIVETLDLFEEDGRPVLVVAYVSGATLADLRARGRLPVPVICRVGRQIAEALHTIHTAVDEEHRPLNILHRDVTPGNIIVGHDGNARLIDLGIARSAVNRADRTGAGYLKGTLRYLAPELLENGKYSTSTDLWGLGMTLWESALGRLAIEGNDAAIYATIVGGRAMQLKPGEKLDPRLRHAIGQLLSQAAECRPPTALDAAMVYRTYEKTFGEDEAKQLAQKAVLDAVGPPEAYTSQVGDARAMLVNRAAATFGGPLGDWRLAEDIETGIEHEQTSDIDPDVTEELDREALLAERNRLQAEAVCTPAPIDDGTLDLSTDEFTDTAAQPGQVPAPAPQPAPVSLAPVGPDEIDSFADDGATELMDQDHARARAREVARRFRQHAVSDDWALPKTVDGTANSDEAQARPRPHPAGAPPKLKGGGG